MWCYECDSYFCESCHQKPHVLVLGSDAPATHHCYAIEGASGKLHGKSSWSMDFAAIAKNVYRLRVLEKISQEAVPTSSNDVAQAADGASARTATIPPPPATAADSIARVDERAEPIVVDGMDAARSGPAESENQAVRSRVDVLGNGGEQINSDEQQQADEVNTAGALPPSSSVVQDTTAAATEARSDAPPTSTVVTTEASSPSRKRKLSDTEAGRTPTAAAPTLSLFERVRLMHEQKAKHQNQQAILQRQRQLQQQLQEQQNRQEQQQRLQEMQAFREQLQAKHQQAKSAQQHLHRQQQLLLQHQQQQEQQRRRSHTIPDPTQTPLQTGAVSRTSPSQTDHVPQTGTLPVVSAAPQTQQQATNVPLPSPQHFQAPQQAVLQPSPTNQHVDGEVGGFMPQVSPPPTAAIVGSSAIVDLSGAREILAPMPQSNYVDGASTMDDPLKFAVVAEYNHVNDYAFKVEARTAELNAKVRQVSMQSVAIAAKLNEQIKVYRTTLEQVYERRYQALAKVIMFSPDVRARVRNIEQSTLGDIPHVLTACHKKCAQLAGDIKTYETNVQNLRNAIDTAISSGDPEKLSQLHLLGKQISSHEQKIQSLKADRDSQFVYMIQFSRKLREVVRQHAVQNAKAKS